MRCDAMHAIKRETECRKRKTNKTVGYKENVYYEHWHCSFYRRHRARVCHIYVIQFQCKMVLRVFHVFFTQVNGFSLDT